MVVRSPSAQFFQEGSRQAYETLVSCAAVIGDTPAACEKRTSSATDVSPQLLHYAAAMDLDRSSPRCPVRRRSACSASRPERSAALRIPAASGCRSARARIFVPRASRGNHAPGGGPSPPLREARRSSNGFIRKSTAPFFIAALHVGTSLCPVMKTICSHAPRASIASCNSRPFSSRHPHIENEANRPVEGSPPQEIFS